MESLMEPVELPGSITGIAIIHDLCDRIAEKLARDCSLRGIDVYRGYAARVSIELQLTDVYPVEVAAEVKVGSLDPALPVQRVVLGESVRAEATVDTSLERPIDESGVIAEAAQAKRYYTPRNRARFVSKSE